MIIKDRIISAISLLAILCSLIWLLGLVITKNEIKINVTQCPELLKKVDIGDIKDCEVRYGSDLLQPSGYWINVNYNCWKLHTPIEDFCKVDNVCLKDGQYINFPIIN